MLMMIFFRFTPLINQVIRFRFWCNFFIVQFYIIKYNFQLDRWIELIFLQELLDMLLYIGFKGLGQSEFGKRLFQMVKVIGRILSNMYV
jgi:hypothetical protein